MIASIGIHEMPTWVLWPFIIVLVIATIWTGLWILRSD
jgi:hypothetical protein